MTRVIPPQPECPAGHLQPPYDKSQEYAFKQLIQQLDGCVICELEETTKPYRKPKS